MKQFHAQQEEQVLHAIIGDDHASLVTLLKACSGEKDLSRGNKLHTYIVKSGFLKKSISVGSTLVNVYAKCGALARAQQVLDEITERNVVSWNVLIVGFVQHGLDEEALECFERMQHEGLLPDAVTFTCMLKASGSTRAIERGRKVHTEIERKLLLRHDTVLGNAVVDMYAKCGALTQAQQVLYALSARNVVSWTSLISGYCQHGYDKEALRCYELMQADHLSPDAVTLLCTLQACGSLGEAEKGQLIHAQIIRDGLLGEDGVLGNAVVEMYAKCGALPKAQQMFLELLVRNLVSWTALIVGYSQHGNGEEALYWFEQMQSEGFSPDAVTLTCVLGACGCVGAIEKGKEIHDDIVRQGLLGNDMVLCTALVDMYAKCGVLEKAQQVFDELPIRNVFVWNALMTGYSQHGYHEQALKCFEHMKSDGLSANEVTLACALKVCGSLKEMEKGKQIHADIARAGLPGEGALIGSALIDMYANCGALKWAQEVFDRLPLRDVVCWTALLAGYSQHGHGDEAVQCFEKMRDEGLSPDALTFSCILKACSSIYAADKGLLFFESMYKTYSIIPRLEDYECIVDVLSHAGQFSKAMAVLEKMPSPNYLPSWFALLSASRKWGDVKWGRLAFEHIVQLYENSIVAYVSMSVIYACSGMQEDAEKTFARAQQLFNELPVWDMVSCNALIGGYYEHGLYKQALDCFMWMKQEGLSPNTVTLLCVLKACGSSGATEMGKQVHGEIIRDGLLGEDHVLGISLVDMYAKCGELVKARQLFDELPHRDLVGWNAVIAGYCQHGHAEEAIHCFEEMKQDGVSPDAMTLASTLSACGSSRAIEKGEEIHVEICRKALLSEDMFLGNALVDMYVKCGWLMRARRVFDELPFQNIFTWNTLLAGYSQYEHEDDVFTLFRCMKNRGLFPNAVTFLHVLKACGSIGAAEMGQEVHAEIARGALLGRFHVLGSALVDMYAKCGVLGKAREVLEGLPIPDAISWTALIAGYCEHGLDEQALNCFEQMRHAGLSPDRVTLTCILRACSGMAAAEKGQMYIEAMNSRYGIVPTLEHHTCMVDLFGRAGDFDEALSMVKKMPSTRYQPTWFALMGACLKWGNVNVGRFAFEQAMELDNRSAVSYFCMSNLYAATSMDKDGNNLDVVVGSSQQVRGPAL